MFEQHAKLCRSWLDAGNDRWGKSMQVREVSLRCTSLISDGGHPLAVTGEGVDLHNLVALLQGPYLHPQLAAQLQQCTLCAVAHPHKLICMPTQHLEPHRKDNLASSHDRQQEIKCTAVDGSSSEHQRRYGASAGAQRGPQKVAGCITYLTLRLASRLQWC